MRISHKWRIALASFAVAGGLFAGVFVGSHRLMARAERNTAGELLDGVLAHAAERLRSDEGLEEVVEETPVQEGVGLRVVGPDGRAAARRGALAFPPGLPEGVSARDGRVYLVKSRSVGGWKIEAAYDWTEAASRLRRMDVLFFALWLPLSAAVGLSAFLAAGQMSGALGRLAAEARQVADSGKAKPLQEPKDPDLARLVRELNAMLARLDDEMRRQERLVADVAHDLRTPITVIRGRLETALLSERPEQHRAAMEIALREAERLTRMANAILQSEAPLGGASPTDLARAVEEARERWLPMFAERGVALEAAIAPACVRLAEGEADILLDNLLENALRFAPAGSVCRLELRREGGQAELSVSDAGPGVPPEHRRAVFDRFVRLQPERDPEGLGLGLFQCRRIAEARGGRIWVEDAPQGGARFVVALPEGA